MIRPPAGLCDVCAHQRVIENTRGSAFSLCERSRSDPSLPRYPRVPVLECPVFERRRDSRETPGQPPRAVPARGTEKGSGQPPRPVPASEIGGTPGRPRTVSAGERRARIGLAIAVAVICGAVAAIVAAAGVLHPPNSGGASAWESLAPSPLERTEVGAGRIGDRIYVVGGFAAAGGATGTTVRYDISANRWSVVAGLPIAVHHPGVTAHRGRLYLLGGTRAGAESDALYRYNPRQDRWRRLADAPSARAGLGLVGIDGRLYAAGGYSAEQATLKTLEIYEIKRNRWQRGAALPTGRNHVGAAVLDGRMVVTGGRPGPTHGNLTEVESYNPRTNRWRRLAPLGTARSGHATVAVRGKLVAFGGEELDGGQTIDEVELYRPRRDSWSPLPPMLTPRHGLGGAAYGARVFAVEGGPQPGLAFSAALEALRVK